MKFFHYIFLGVIVLLTFGCNQNPNYYGHWRCDRTGTAKNLGDPERPIVDLYNVFGMEYFEFEILENGDFILYDHEKSTTVTIPYTKNNQENVNGIVAAVDNDTFKIVFNTIQPNKMHLDWDLEGNGDIVLKMNVDRL